VKGVDRLSPRDALAQRWSVLGLTILPLFGLAAAVGLAWGRGLGVSDVVAFVITYYLAGFGIAVGFHRLFTHCSFETGPRTRVILAIAGSMAIEGPVLEWVADHRRHHAFSDQHGDPHSPHVVDGEDHGGLMRGLLHAHLGWLFKDERTSQERWAKDLLADPGVMWVDRWFPAWIVLGFVIPAGIGYAVSGGRPMAALTGMLWGGAVRVLVLNHVTFSINSICHVFGRREYATTDHSTNNWVLAIPSMGESWHNNHHAFPSSAHHGLAWYQVDLAALVIRSLERLGLAWNVKVPGQDVLDRRRIARRPSA
jgi:stearoyl-CoA desaturase (delta-9 desaturase)